MSELKNTVIKYIRKFMAEKFYFKFIEHWRVYINDKKYKKKC